MFIIRAWSVSGPLVPRRGGKEAPILLSPLFLLHNWSGVCQSPETDPQNSPQS